MPCAMSRVVVSVTWDNKTDRLFSEFVCVFLVRADRKFAGCKHADGLCCRKVLRTNMFTAENRWLFIARDTVTCTAYR